MLWLLQVLVAGADAFSVLWNFFPDNEAETPPFFNAVSSLLSMCEVAWGSRQAEAYYDQKHEKIS